MAMQGIKVEVLEATKKDAVFSFYQNAPGTIIFDRTGPLFWYAGWQLFYIFSKYGHAGYQNSGFRGNHIKHLLGHIVLGSPL